MSKKLLMNNYSENGLMPVMEGLICWLDDRDDREGNRINDRVGLNDFLLEGDFGDKPYHLSNKHKFFSEKAFSLANQFSISMTVNISSIGSYGCLLIRESAKGSPYSTFKIGNRNNNKIGFYSSMAGAVNKGVDILLNRVINFTIVFKNDSIYFYDYEKVADSPISKFSFSHPIQIGSYEYSATDRSNFMLHSVKIYNRALTEKEIQQNYLYEQSIERG